MLKNFIRPVLYNATRHLKIQPFNNFHPQWHIMPKFYFFQYEKSLLYRFLNYEDEIKQLEEATQRQQPIEKELDSHVNLILYLENLLPYHPNLSYTLPKYVNSLIELSHFLEQSFALHNFSSQNKYILITEKFFNNKYLQLSDSLQSKIMEQKHKLLKLIIDGAKLDFVNLNNKIIDYLDFYDYIDQQKVPELEQFLLREKLRKIYFLFIISKIFKQRRDKQEEERFFEDGLVELKKYVQFAIGQNKIILKQSLLTLIFEVCLNLLLFKDKKDSDNYQKFIQHLFDLAELLDDDSLRVCVTQLHIDYLVIQQQQVDIDVFHKLYKITKENDISNRLNAFALLARSIMVDKHNNQAKIQLLQQFDPKIVKAQFQGNYFELYYYIKYIEIIFIKEILNQDISNFNERIDALLMYIDLVNQIGQGNAHDYDFFSYLLPVVLKGGLVPQEHQSLLLQKLLQAFQQIQPKEFTGSKQELENQYSLTLILLILKKQENITEQACIVEYKKFITQFMDINMVADDYFYIWLIDLNFRILYSLQQKEHAEELKNCITQAIQKAHQLKGQEHKNILNLQLHEANKLTNKKE